MAGGSGSGPSQLPSIRVHKRRKDTPPLSHSSPSSSVHVKGFLRDEKFQDEVESHAGIYDETLGDSTLQECVIEPQANCYGLQFGYPDPSYDPSLPSTTSSRANRSNNPKMWTGTLCV